MNNRQLKLTALKKDDILILLEMFRQHPGKHCSGHSAVKSMLQFSNFTSLS